MPKSERLIVMVESGQKARLRRLAKARGLSSTAELARLAIEEYEHRHAPKGEKKAPSIFDKSLRFTDKPDVAARHDDYLYGDEA